MRTSSGNTSAQRLSALIKTGRNLFHTDDLALLWQIRNPNTLRITLARAAKDGWLYRIRRGLYSLRPAEEIEPELLGTACLHRYCYVSTETILRDAGIILQSISAITFASSVSRCWEAGGSRFISRRLSERFLMNATGIEAKNGALRATSDRAIADMLYFDPWYHFDRPFDWKSVMLLQREIGYPLTPNRYVDSALK